MTRPAPTSSVSSISRRATRQRAILLDVVTRTAEACFMPLTVGGGVRTVEDVRTLLASGADKVSINTAAVQRRAFVKEAAEKFGDQCIVVAIDAKQVSKPGEKPRWEIFTHGGRNATGLDAVRLRQGSGGARRRGNPAHLHGPRRHQVRLRHRADPRGFQRGDRAGDRLGRGRARSITWSKASAMATPPRCSPPRSSISGNSPSPRPSGTWPKPASRCASIRDRAAATMAFTLEQLAKIIAERARAGGAKSYTREAARRRRREVREEARRGSGRNDARRGRRQARSARRRKRRSALPSARPVAGARRSAFRRASPNLSGAPRARARGKSVARQGLNGIAMEQRTDDGLSPYRDLLRAPNGRRGARTRR